ncbi:MAG TPA: dihydroorotate dehydrogenase [Candidatus Limnocylindrales bacterium]|nr:dihydroorotate dehydrogenase [Candidatus Limnocylindrales bacterium]
MKARRRVVPGVGSRRSPTVRTVRPVIRSPQAPPQGPGATPAGGAGTTAGRDPATPAATDLYGARPVAMEVPIGRGLVLQTPVIAASGPFGYGVELAEVVDIPRLGGLVTRGTTLRARAGHAAPRTADVAGGLLVGIGPQNPGIDAVLERYAPAWARWTTPVIVNLCGESAGDLSEMARRLDGVPGIAAIELNLSCQNGGRNAFGLDEGATGSVVAAVRRATELPLIAKLTPAAADPRAIARAAEDAGADAISAVNTLPGLALAADRGGPALASGYGGICGPALKPVALRVVWEVAQAVDVPVIGIGGIATLDDVLDFLAAGAAAVGIGVAAMADPMLAVRLGDELADACRGRGLDSVTGLTGTALPGRPSAPSTRGAEYAR